MLSSRSRRRLLKLATGLIAKITHTDSGAFNKFAPISESWGVKFCYDKEQAVRNYQRQRRAARHGLGPICFGFFGVFSETYGEYIYGYITEIVEVDFLSEKDADTLSDWCCGWIEEGSHPMIWMRHLVNKLTYKTGFEFEDNHARNIGRTRNKEIVCIDFDY